MNYKELLRRELNEIAPHYAHDPETWELIGKFLAVLDGGMVIVGRGNWEPSEIPEEGYNCSHCGGAAWYYDYEGEISKSRFCPNCGAEMKRDQKVKRLCNFYYSGHGNKYCQLGIEWKRCPHDGDAEKCDKTRKE